MLEMIPIFLENVEAFIFYFPTRPSDLAEFFYVPVACCDAGDPTVVIQSYTLSESWET